jgi:O-acetyl-ADP-ribose deacetylase
MHALEVDGTTIRTFTGDLTAERVDAIVNAANAHLQHGGGVAGAISRAAGPVVQRESDAWVAEHGPLGDDTAAVTGAGALPCRLVVHVAGPVHDAARDDNEARLRAAVTAALDAGHDQGARTMALPAISSGIYGYPLAEATAVLVSAVADWVRSHPGALHEVRLVGFDDAATAAFASALGSSA